MPINFEKISRRNKFILIATIVSCLAFSKNISSLVLASGTNNFGLQISPLCGNDIKETGEQCDGTDFGGASCASQGFGSGSLSCAANCTFIASSCVAAPGGGTGGGPLISPQNPPGSTNPIIIPPGTPPPSNPGTTPGSSPGNPIIFLNPQSPANGNFLINPLEPTTNPTDLNSDYFDFIFGPVQSGQWRIIDFIVFLTLVEILLILLGMILIRRIRRYMIAHSKRDKKLK